MTPPLPLDVDDADIAARVILDFLLFHHPALFAVEELRREFTVWPDRGVVFDQVEEAVGRLIGAGLVHRVAGELVVATWAAVRAKQLVTL